MKLYSKIKGRDDYTEEGQGWSSFWWPAGVAIVFFAFLIYFFATATTRNVVEQVEEKVNNKIDKLTNHVIVAKYDSATQTQIDSIELHRKILMSTLMICTMLSFRTYSTPLSTRTDTLEIPEPISLDSVKRIVPIGYYILSEKGAKKSIKASIDAVAYFQKWQIADKAASQMAVTVSTVTMQRNQAMDINVRNTETIGQLTTKLKWAIFWKYAAICATAALGTQLIIR